ncbi:probable ammonium transporter [Klebsormidium nitens]|uniref:protein-serine/threonine phosphatase n=1 Tax=Klebsormidium nitens TaxID=105231 RepID=A0A1Y1HKX8_KLENI|nr:probable ammonium transporter [Klebsormidium nitens]|eukprot:GAQ77789.1 probable ammonium transporter [Klebsormidium nitens]
MDPATNVTALALRVATLEVGLQELAATSTLRTLVAGHLWTLQAGIFVFLMQVGFALVEAGTVRTKNTRNIMIKNILDACISAVAFWSFGYALAYGTGNKVLGWRHPDGSSSAAFFNERDKVRWFYKWTYAATTATIVNGAVAERTKFPAYLVYSFLLSGFIYPVVVHLMWSADGLLSPYTYHKILGGDGYIDLAGATIVHVTGGLTSFLGAWMVGPRIGRFDIDGKPIEFKHHSIAFIATGTLILWVGFYGFNGGSVYISDDLQLWLDTIARIMMNATVSAAFSGLTVFAVSLMASRAVQPSDTFNGVIGGLVAASATASVTQTWAACIVGFLSGLAYFGGSRLFLWLHIDDPVNAAAVHLCCGCVGGLAVGLFATNDGIRAAYGIPQPRAQGLVYGGDFTLLGTQVVGLLLIIGWVGATAFCMFFILLVTGNLRSSRQAEEVGLDVAYHGGTSDELPAQEQGVFVGAINKTIRRRLSSSGFGSCRKNVQWWRSRSFLGLPGFQKNLKRTPLGQYALSTYEANYLMEDTWHMDSLPNLMYMGVFDGHGGTEAATFAKERLHEHLQDSVAQNGLSEDSIAEAFLNADAEFTDLIRTAFVRSPHLATVGSCALVAVLTSQATLYVAGLGDCRAVLGTGSNGRLKAVQLSEEHNVNIASHRKAYLEGHPEGEAAVACKNGMYRVKGKLQVTRSFGDCYMKLLEFNSAPLFPRFRCPAPYHPPYVTARPSVTVRQLQPSDRFLILASDGLWNYLGSQDAVDIVQKNVRGDVARLLVRTALQRAAQKHEITFEELMQLPRGMRRDYHDDMTVVVFFFKQPKPSDSARAIDWEGSFHRRISSASSRQGDDSRDVEMGEVKEEENDGRPDFRNLPTLKVTRRGPIHTGSSNDILSMPTYEGRSFRMSGSLLDNVHSPT